MSGTQQPVAQAAVANSGGSTISSSRVSLPSTNAWARPLQHNATTAATTRTAAATRVASTTTATTTTTVAALGNHTTTKKPTVGKEELQHTSMLLRERFLHLISSLIGQRVVLTKINGTQVEGILHTFTPFEESSSLVPEQRNLYVLKSAKLLHLAEEVGPTISNSDVFPEGSTVLIPAPKVHSVQVQGFPLLLTPTTSSTRNSNNTAKKDLVSNSSATPTTTQQQFLTDSDISSSKALLHQTNNMSSAAEKVLVAAGSVWTSGSTTNANQHETVSSTASGGLLSNTTSTKRTSSSNNTTASAASSLPWRPQRSSTPTSSSLGGYASAVKASATTKPSELSGTIGGWDQFQANEKLFNVKATFDENQYTTALDKSAIPTHLQDRAERMAREIEGQSSDNIHIREERGIVSCAEDLDEEDKYSGVLRRTTAAATPQDKPEPPPQSQESDKEEVEKSSSDNYEVPTEPVISKETDSEVDESILNTTTTPVGDDDVKSTSENLAATTSSTTEEESSKEKEGNITVEVSVTTEDDTQKQEEQQQQQQPTPPATSSKLNPSAKEFTFNPTAKSFTPSAAVPEAAATTITYFDPSAGEGVPPSFLPHHHYPHPQQLIPAGYYTNYRPPPPPPPPGATAAGPYNPMTGQHIPMVPAGNPYGMYRGPMQPGMIPGPAHPPPPFYPGGYHGHNMMYGGGVGGPMQQQPTVQGGSGGNVGRMMEGEDGGYRGRGGGNRGMVRGGGGGVGRRSNMRNNNAKGGRGMMPGRGGPYYPTPMSYSGYNPTAVSVGGPMAQHGDPQATGVVLNYYDTAADPGAFVDQQNTTPFVQPSPNNSTDTAATAAADPPGETEVPMDQVKETEKEP